MTHASEHPTQPELLTPSRRLLVARRGGPLVAVVGLVGLVACGAQGGGSQSSTAAASSPDATVKPALSAVSVASQPSLPATSHAAGVVYGFVADADGQAARSHVLAQGLEAELSAGHLHVSPAAGAWQLDLQWVGVGRGARVSQVAAAEAPPEVRDQRARYVHADAGEEWYSGRGGGVEQGFVLPTRPAGGGESLVLDIAAAGLVPGLAANGALVRLHDPGGRAVASYGELSAVDSSGAPLHTSLEVDGSHIRLRIDDSSARYPVTVDPVVWATPQELEASDDAANDWFGYAVAASGSIAVVGAPNHSVGGHAEAGAAYVYSQVAGTWALAAEITAPDGAAGDLFGASVAVGDSYLLIGAPGRAVGAGGAYVFSGSGTSWAMATELTGSAAGGAFGTSVSISSFGTAAVALVGAPNHTVGAASQAGAAYPYTLSGTAWNPGAPLTASDGAAFDAFGTSVSVSVTTNGTSAVAGAPYHTAGGKLGAGAAYTFTQSGTTWTPSTELTASDGAASDGFGMSVSVSGSSLWVGAPYHTARAHSQAGAAYVFDQGATGWSQAQEVTAGDAALADLFGYSVSVDGTNAIVGAYQHDVSGVESAGAAYLYFQTCPTWIPDGEVTAIDDGVANFFGFSVATSQAAAVVGAYQHSVGASVSAGAVYVYDGSNAAPSCCIGGASVASGAANPGDSCQLCTPATSSNTWSWGTDGAACVGTDACLQTYACQSGACVGSDPVACTVTSCNTVACNPSTGHCDQTPVANGTTCAGTNPCLQSYSCQVGVCTGTNPVTCTATDQCHSAACSTATGQCVQSPVTDGTSCTGTNACLQSYSCQVGMCTGSNPVACVPVDQCHSAACDPSSGACGQTTLADGTACTGGVCTGGVCTSTTDAGSSSSASSTGTSGSSASSSGTSSSGTSSSGASSSGTSTSGASSTGTSSSSVSSSYASSTRTSSSRTSSKGTTSSGTSSSGSSTSGVSTSGTASSSGTSGTSSASDASVPDGGAGEDAGTSSSSKEDGGESSRSSSSGSHASRKGDAASDSGQETDASPDGAALDVGSTGGCGCRAAGGQGASPVFAGPAGLAACLALLGLRRRRSGAEGRSDR